MSQHIQKLDPNFRAATLFDGPFARDCTVDGCHPNDLGFSRMALKIAPAISRVLNL